MFQGIHILLGSLLFLLLFGSLTLHLIINQLYMNFTKANLVVILVTSKTAIRIGIFLIFLDILEYSTRLMVVDLSLVLRV